MSVEHCRVQDGGGVVVVESAITGQFGVMPFNTEYHIRLNTDWEMMCADIQVFSNGTGWAVRLERSARGWILNDVYDPRFDGCADIDISVTPMTNSLPIRRLGLDTGESQGILVVYVDVLERKVEAMPQAYTRTGIWRYEYKNEDYSRRGELLTDEDGLVVNYPGLFRMDHMGPI